MSTRRNTLFSGVLIAVASVAIGLVIAARLDLVSSPTAQTINTSAGPAMPAMPPGGMAGAFSGISAMIASVVSIMPAMLLAVSSATRQTLVGSITPASNMSPNSSRWASYP